MTTHQVVSTKNIFIDSDTLTNQSSSKAHVLFPAAPFSVCCGDTIRLTLNQFVMPRRIYTVNVTNKLFYIRNATADTYQEIAIPEGTYASFAALAAAIQVGLRAPGGVLANATCTYDDDTRKLVITMPGVDASSFIVCFQSRETRPTGVSAQGFFQQSHILLGGRPTRSSVLVNAFGSTGTGAMTAPYPACLSSMDSLYLRSGIMSGAYQSVGHERYLPNGNSIIESQIWARIPISDPTSTNPIIFEDNGNEQFQLNPTQRNLDSLDLWITDEFGRSLAEVSPHQYEDGMMNFTATIKWSHLTLAKPSPNSFKTPKDLETKPIF